MLIKIKSQWGINGNYYLACKCKWTKLAGITISTIGLKFVK